MPVLAVQRFPGPGGGIAPSPAVRARAAPARPFTARVLYVSERMYPEAQGEAALGMHRLLRRLRDLGWETATCTWRGRSHRRFRDVLHRHDPDWVFTRWGEPPGVACEAKRQGRRVAVFVWDVAAVLRGRGAPAARREWLRCADRVVCPSDYLRRVVERAVPEAPRPVVQYPIVDPPRDVGRMRRRYLAAVRPGPGRERRLFEELVRLLGDREFLVVGGGALDVPWRRVAWLPAAVDRAEVYRAARILLRPTVTPEAFGLPVAEAAACGVPSVVSRRGGLPEALGPGGVAVDGVRDPGAWLAAVEEVERHYDRYAALARRHAARFRNADALAAALSPLRAGTRGQPEPNGSTGEEP